MTAFEMEFLAPDGAALEATAKALVRGAPSLAQDAVTLSIDGKPCADARCPFQAAKARPTNWQPRRNCAILRSFASSLPGPDGYLLLRYMVFYPSPSLCRQARVHYSSTGDSHGPRPRPIDFIRGRLPSTWRAEPPCRNRSTLRAWTGSARVRAPRPSSRLRLLRPPNTEPASHRTVRDVVPNPLQPSRRSRVDQRLQRSSQAC